MADTPWTKGPFEYRPKERRAIVSANGTYLAFVTQHKHSKADGLLFSAAPEYDELLGEAIDIFEGDLTGVEWKRAWRDFTHRAKALRAKARGEQ